MIKETKYSSTLNKLYPNFKNKNKKTKKSLFINEEKNKGKQEIVQQNSSLS